MINNLDDFSNDLGYAIQYKFNDSNDRSSRRQKQFKLQKLFGIVFMLFGILSIMLTGNDITIAIILVPLGLVLMLVHYF